MNVGKLLYGSVLVVMILFLIIPAAMAYQGAPPAPAPAGQGAPAPAPGDPNTPQQPGDAPAGYKDKSLLDVINAGGLVGHCIIIVNIISIALMIENAVTIQRDKLVPPEMVVEMETLLEEQQYEDLVSICEGTKNYITTVVGAALVACPNGYEAMESAAGTAMDEQNLKLNQKISYINLCGVIGPLMGLFGTVTGMIGAFMEIEKKMTPTPAELGKGVYEALVTTVEGLIVGMPCTIAFFYFQNKVNKLTFELGSVSMEFVEKLKPIAGQEIIPREEAQ